MNIGLPKFKDNDLDHFYFRVVMSRCAFYNGYLYSSDDFLTNAYRKEFLAIFLFVKESLLINA